MKRPRRRKRGDVRDALGHRLDLRQVRRAAREDARQHQHDAHLSRTLLSLFLVLPGLLLVWGDVVVRHATGSGLVRRAGLLRRTHLFKVVHACV